ncbi:MAG: hypothetical protein D6729_16705 [Deltaproteobacteria bacterium]|nr:MAG: hypothetical protein D6729_16705 [Deltaproteobacteria bacterium]
MHSIGDDGGRRGVRGVAAASSEPDRGCAVGVAGGRASARCAPTVPALPPGAIRLLCLALLAGGALLACPGPSPTRLDGGAPDGAGGDAGGGGRDGGRDGGGTDGGGDGGGAPRRLDALDPVRGTADGGYGVELFGAGFEEGMQVLFGQADCEALQILSDARASCRVPPGSPGRVDVRALWRDGFESRLEAAFEYLAPGTISVGYGRLLSPNTDGMVAPGGSVEVLAEVYAEGVTPGPGQGAGLSLQAAVGPETADPATEPERFAWEGLAYAGDRDGLVPGDLANDAYAAVLTAPTTPGRYRLAARVLPDAGDPVNLDPTGTDDGFDPATLPIILVEEPPPNLPDWCNTQWPPSIDFGSTAGPVTVYGQVYEPGLTDSGGDPSALVAELGYGPDGSDPAADPGVWTWTPGAYNASCSCGNNYEYMADLSIASSGRYDYAWRFSLDGGAHYVYCDTTGLADGYDPADAGDAVVP